MIAGLLAADDRLLVLGGGGWFGQTLLHDIAGAVPVLATASAARPGLEVFDAARIREFGPTVVANFAFLTRERVATEGIDAFTRVNRLLTGQFLSTLDLPGVRAALTVSSGAAVTEPDEPYGRLKLEEEREALLRASDTLATCVARAYAVSGPFVRRPRDYAFSDMILQAAGGHVMIRAGQPTYRRFVSVSDLLEVSLGTALAGRSGIVDSGGELVEMADLASRIAARVNPSAVIERVPMVSDVPSVYASDDTSWTAACQDRGFTPLGLDQQIDAVARGLTPGRG